MLREIGASREAITGSLGDIRKDIRDRVTDPDQFY